MHDKLPLQAEQLAKPSGAIDTVSGFIYWTHMLKTRNCCRNQTTVGLTKRMTCSRFVDTVGALQPCVYFASYQVFAESASTVRETSNGLW